MPESSHAVFLSYASEDAEPAQRIAEALRAAGVEVWFDKSELRGGDVWDRMIRKQIKGCALFVPVISRHTHERREGYFRLEWKLAADRSNLMSSTRAFLVPVVIDDTREDDEEVPERIREVHWTRLPEGETPPAFVERVKRLLSPENSHIQDPARSASGAVANHAPVPLGLVRRGTGVLYGAIAAVVLLALGYVGFERLNRSKPNPPGAASIAVLPLTNESGEASQQYFSDGISEDLITALSQFPGLKVIGRTSAFQFRDSKEDSRSIGTKLGVAHLLEGSVRRSGEMVRVSAELIDTADGSAKWSERYDRPYKDLFGLQDEITRAVAGALRTKLLPGEHAEAQSDRPPSGNLEAYNALLEGKFFFLRDSEADIREALERFTRATQLDPHYATAWSYVSRAWAWLGGWHLDLADARQAYAKARTAADTALALAPNLARAHIARGRVLEFADLDWRGAGAEYRRAFELAPNDGEAKNFFVAQLAMFGQVDRAIELTRQLITDDPLYAGRYAILADYLSAVNHVDEAERMVRKAIELRPGSPLDYLRLTNIEIQRGNAGAALTAAQQGPPWAYKDAAVDAALQIGNDRNAADAAMEKLIKQYATVSPYSVAAVYAIRNDTDKTFEWLDRAWRDRDPSIGGLLTDPFIVRYKDDPRFAAFCRKVGLPTPSEVAAHKT